MKPFLTKYFSTYSQAIPHYIFGRQITPIKGVCKFKRRTLPITPKMVAKAEMASKSLKFPVKVFVQWYMKKVHVLWKNKNKP